MDWISALPLGWAILLFWAGAILRATTTYALGRGLAAGARHTRLRRRLTGPASLRATRFVDRWGPWAIPLCFLTVGLQTAVIATAGITRMRWGRFLPAMLLGALLWGILYGTVGMAVVWAALAAAVGSPWFAAALGLVGAGVLVLWRTGVPARVRAARQGRRSGARAPVPDGGRRAPSSGPSRPAQPDTTSGAGR